jgi:hypothetical protein
MTKGVVREDRERERASALINEGSKQEQIRHHNSLLSIIVTFFHTTPQSTLRSDTLEADAWKQGFFFFSSQFCDIAEMAIIHKMI